MIVKDLDIEISLVVISKTGLPVKTSASVLKRYHQKNLHNGSIAAA